MPGFVDEVQLHVKAGDGGAGAVSFRREAHVSRGGPDGGDGGRGGDVWLEASPRLASLLAFKDHPYRRAPAGVHGQGAKRDGARGGDAVVLVPQGTVVRSLKGDLLADLHNAGARWRAAEGGRGGRGNASFLSNQVRAPGFAEQGELGEEGWFDLELKLMADVALVGMPNAGKSTLISVISAARPKIAGYPFTTLVPHLGVVRRGGTEMVVADIPGLIEGAADGRGLGHQFLRHVERTRALVVLLDLDPNCATPPADQERVLIRELARYRAELLDRPRLVVGSKADLLHPAAAHPAAAHPAAAHPAAAHPAAAHPAAAHPAGRLEVSAQTGAGLDELLAALAGLVEAARSAEATAGRPEPGRPEPGGPEPGSVGAQPAEPVLHLLQPAGISVNRLGERSWAVSGRAATRAVSVNDLNDPGALAHVQRRLQALGVDRALARAGAKHGDSVSIASFNFTYESQ